MSDFILEVRNVTKKYATHQALSNVSLQVPRKQIFGLLGPNGAGKSTLIRIITQIISKDAGEILFNGKPLLLADAERIGYLPEERGLYKKMKVGEQLVYLSQLKGLSKKDAMNKLKIWFEKFDITAWWNKNVEDLSKGMQQKVQFIATVLHEPELLILDEPFSGFDPVNAQIITKEILELQRKGTTIIFSTHRMETVEELCEHIALINKSEKILDGGKNEIKEKYRASIYKVSYKGDTAQLMSALPSDFKFLETETESDFSKTNIFTSYIQIPKGFDTNDFIKILLQNVQIVAFQEQLPSINDIFISLVTGTTIYKNQPTIESFNV